MRESTDGVSPPSAADVTNSLCPSLTGLQRWISKYTLSLAVSVCRPCSPHQVTLSREPGQRLGASALLARYCAERGLSPGRYSRDSGAVISVSMDFGPIAHQNLSPLEAARDTKQQRRCTVAEGGGEGRGVGYRRPQAWSTINLQNLPGPHRCHRSIRRSCGVVAARNPSCVWKDAHPPIIVPDRRLVL